MDETKTGSAQAFQAKLQEVVDAIGVKTLPVDLDLLKEYCRLTGHDFARCQARDLLPTGFLMTFTSPIFSEMFLAFFVKLPKLIKGVIHTASQVEFFGPLRLGAGPYQEKLAIRNLEEKSGKKGNYWAVDFEVSLMDTEDRKIVSDVHQFFLRV